MSIPVSQIICTKCDLKTLDTIIWGRYEYDLGFTRIPLDRRAGWCHSCSAVRAIEYIKDPPPEPQYSKSFIYRMKLSLWGTVKRSQKEMDDGIKRVGHDFLHKTRQGDVKCLNCGSTEVQYLHSRNSVEPQSAITDSNGNQFLHHGCGGELKSQDADLRINMKFDAIRIYDSKGLFLREEAIHDGE